MTIDRMIELLKIEHECMLKNSHGDCNRRCEDCDLVQDDGELHEMYENVIGLIEGIEPREPYIKRDGRTTFFLCGGCNKPLCIAKDSYNPKHCPECGKAVKWQ